MTDKKYMDGFLKSNLDILKKNIKEDWDFWAVIDGREGVGKSTLAQQVGEYLDPTLDISRIVFTPQQFEKSVDEAKPYQTIVWDESITGTQSIDMTRMARTLKKKAVQMRQKNLFIILVIHSYFDMNKYYAVHRTWFLLHVYHKSNKKTKTFHRGYFEFYNFQKKKMMYLNDKARRFYNYIESPNFRGRFTKRYAIDKDAYLKKKATIEDVEDIRFTKRNVLFWLWDRHNELNLTLTDKEIIDVVKTSKRYYYECKKEYGGRE